MNRQGGSMIFGQGWIRQKTKHGFICAPPAAMALCHDHLKRSKGCIADWYMVKRAVWEKAWPGTASRSAKDVPMKHFLCIQCLEQRLGRRLTRRDFDLRRAANDPKRARSMPMSPLFRRRLRTRP